MLNLEDMVKKVVTEIKKINEINDNDIIYMFDSVTDEYNIIHNFQERINLDDNFADKLGEILSSYLFENGYFNVNFYEDEGTLEKYTISTRVESSKKNNWENNFDLNINLGAISNPGVAA